MKKLLAVDGNGLMHRAFHALPPFKTASGIPTQVVFGFFSILHKSIIDFHPSHLVICFDTPAPTFRNALLPEYQAQRPKITDDFIQQIPMIKEALTCNNTVFKELDGYEGDDVIATVAKKAEGESFDVLILTGDKDMMQLVNQHISTVTPEIGFSKTKIYTEEAVFQKMGVPPVQIPDLKALAGDPSDNYKGAEGIGRKTAQKLLSEYGSVQTLLSKIDTLPKGTLKDRLLASIDNIKIGIQLSRVKTDVPISIDFTDALWNGFSEKLKEQFLAWEMYSLVRRLYPKQRKTEIKKKTTKVDENQIAMF